MNPISNIGSISSIIQGIASSTGSTAASQSGTFQSVLESSINTVEGLQKSAGDSIQNFLSGQNEDLHTTVLATQQAEMAFQLGMQVRNKVVSAYQEIMKMPM